MINPPSLLPDTLMARRLRVSAEWLREEAAAGRLPHVRAGNRYLFNPQAIEALLVERARRPITKCADQGRPHNEDGYHGQ